MTQIIHYASLIVFKNLVSYVIVVHKVYGSSERFHNFTKTFWTYYLDYLVIVILFGWSEAWESGKLLNGLVT